MTYSTYEPAITAIRQFTDFTPSIGLVLGSGLGALAEAVTDRTVIPYTEIPGWPVSTVIGHSGQLIFGKLEGHSVVVQQGRAHFYEGYSLQQVTFPIRIMYHLGVRSVILTNAAGGINPNFRAGDVMVINDHINFIGMAGNNPLLGPNDERYGPRFLGMTQTYDRTLRRYAHQVAAQNGITLHEGVYACLSGPTFETPAEVRMLRVIGADAVGMSTAPEVVIARHCGMQVMAFSGITNVAIDNLDVDLEASHEEVLETGMVLVPKLTTLIRGILGALPA
ncbi:MAG: purine-nucleoside phosphorylase [Anaerolineae bacterium]